MKNLTTILLLALVFLSSSAIAANRYWVANATGNWSDPLNWSTASGGTPGASVPGAADVAIFNSGGNGDCMLNAIITINSINVTSIYPGNIIQQNFTLTITGTATFAGGAFTGAAADIVIGGALTLSGTAFTAPSATLECRSTAAFTGGSYTHNNGHLFYNYSGTGTITISGVSPALYDLSFSGAGGSYNITSTGNLTVANDFSLGGTGGCYLNTGTIEVAGDITVTNTGTLGGGTALILVNGTANQAWQGSSTAGFGALPRVTINKTSGTLSLTGFPGVANTFIYTAGTINAGISTFCFLRTSSGAYTATGSLTLANLYIGTAAASALTLTVAAGSVITATGNLEMGGAGNLVLNTGTIAVQGNVSMHNTATAGGGSAILLLNGTANQVLDGSILTVQQNRLPIVSVNKASGTLFLQGNLSFPANMQYVAGTINPGTSMAYIVNTLTISGNWQLYDVTVATSAATTITISTGSIVNVNRHLSLGTGTNNVILNTGTIAVGGDLIDNNTGTGGGGTATILFNGNAAQAIYTTGVISQGRLPAITINKLSGVLTLPSLITVRSNWTYIAGSIDAVSNDATVVFNNTLSITGSHTLNHVNFFSNGSYTYTIATGTTLTVSGDCTTGGASNAVLNTGTINLAGDLMVNNSATGSGGTATINFNGTGSQSITSTAAISRGRLPVVRIDKPSGILLMSGIISASRNWLWVAGIVDNGTSTVVFGGNNLSVTSNGMTFNDVTITGNTITIANTMTIEGNLVINAGALAPGTNTINLAGNWTSFGTAGFTESTSTVVFNGSAVQAISCTGGETFNSVTISNSPGIQLGTNITVGATLNMSGGDIALNGNNVNIGTSTTNRGTLNRTSGRISGTGTVSRWYNTGVLAAGASATFFPIGNATDQRFFYVAPSTAPSAGGTIQVTYTDASTHIPVFIPDGVFTVLERSNFFWTITAGNGLNGGTWEIRAESSGFGVVNSLGELRLTQASTVAGTAGTNGGTLTLPQINRTGVPFASLATSWYTGSVAAGILPEDLLSFAVTAKQNDALLHWELASASTVSQVTLQRSSNGRDWSDITSIDTRNSTTIQQYEWKDRLTQKGIIYYRLSMMHLSGRKEYSDVRTINISSTGISIALYPNPVVNQLIVEGTALQGIHVYNTQGQLITVPVRYQGDRALLQMSVLPAGLYLLRITSNETVYSRQVVVER